ncbi:MAG: ATP-binding protein [Bryobacteraceae bacterium]
MADPNCPKCGGTGWITEERNGLSGAMRCGCGADGRALQLQERANIPLNYRSSAFDNFKLPTDNPTARNGLSIVINTVRSYAREFPATDKPGLLLVGDPGTGKTHLAVAALRALIAKGFEGAFFDYQNLFEQIKAGYDPSSGSSNKEAYRSALDTEILLLDDLGAHRVTDWVEDTVTSIITYRCNHRKALIATTNLPDPDAGSLVVDRGPNLGGKPEYRTTLAERIGMRARSRLFEMCRVIKMPQVEDFRLKRR